MEDSVPYGDKPPLKPDNSELELCSSRRCQCAATCLRHQLFLDYCDNPDRDATVRFACHNFSLYISATQNNPRP